MTEPRTASAGDKPCQLYAAHSPVVVRTQGHHRHPVALQNRVYGRIQDPELLWLCGSCHDSVHSWINYLLGEWDEPNPHPGRNVKAEARRTVEWYTAALVSNVDQSSPPRPQIIADKRFEAGGDWVPA